ncbi:MAG: hypothetical protein LBS64_00010 [Spirochaetaceae bacterium]|jgi:hypothetical protein|nr:hypothetical protein [Spirochaetaceae bacterium]
MSNNTDWMPGIRAEVLALAVRWDGVLAAKPDGVKTNAEAWGIPDAEVTGLHTLIEGAAELLTTVEGPGATATLREKCREAFEALEKAMRALYWYFSNPKFLDADRVLLGLHLHDRTPTPVPVPVTQCTGEAITAGLHLVETILGAYVNALSGDERARYGVRIYYGIMPQGGASVEEAAGPKHYLMKPPTTGEELPNSVFTRKHKHLFDFEGESAKTAYFCLRFENPSGGSGPFGPIFSAVIT